MDPIAHYLASEGLRIGAIKLRPDDPFQWASGYRMPIYNDNRMFLGYDEALDHIVNGFAKLIREKHGLEPQFVAGTSTAGIPHASILGKTMKWPITYVRDKPKDHGLKNQIEGIDAASDLGGRLGIVIEDLISTGGSSADAVQAVRNANGNCNYCFSIFSYGLSRADEAFAKLNPACIYDSLLTYDQLLEVAMDEGKFNNQQLTLLEEWRADPFNWGANHGFPKVEKKK